MVSASDILQSAATVIAGLLIFLTLGYRSDLIKYILIPAQSGSTLKKRIRVGAWLLLSVFSLLAISIVLSLFDETQIAKWSLISAVIALIIRIALNDRFRDNDPNQNQSVNIS